jgi:hypothetical protein
MGATYLPTIRKFDRKKLITVVLRKSWSSAIFEKFIVSQKHPNVCIIVNRQYDNMF